MHVTDRRPPERQNCHQFLRLTGSKLRKHLSITKNYIRNIKTLQATLTKRLRKVKNKQIIDVSSQMLPPKGFLLPNSRTATEQFREKSGKEQVLFLDNSNSCTTEIQESREHIIITLMEIAVNLFSHQQPHTLKKSWWKMNRLMNCIPRYLIQ